MREDSVPEMSGEGKKEEEVLAAGPKSSSDKSNILGSMEIQKLFLRMAIPLIISMLVQAMYSVVDSIFVGHLCEEGLTAVSLVNPIQNLMIAVSTGTGVGFNAIISRRLGQGKGEEANRTANNGVLLAIISYIVFMLVGLLFSQMFISGQTPADSVNRDLIVSYGSSYMRIVTVLGFALFGQVTMERLLQSTGLTIYNMYTQLTGAVINIILDPILIFGLGPFPRLEVAGAAYATVIGQAVAMIMGIIFNIKYNPEIHFSLRLMKPKASIIAEIYKIGIPSILMISIGSVMTFGMNKIVISFTATAVAVFGVYFRIQSVVFMPLFGMNNALIPIIGYNFGAHKKERILKAVKTGYKFGLIFMWVGFAVFQLAPGPLMSLFGASENMLSIGIPAMHRISIIFLVAAISVISGSLFQATGKSMYSLIVSFVRQMVVLLPVAYLLSLTGRLNMVWWSLPIAEIAGLLITLGLKAHLVKNLDQMMNRME